MTGKRLNLSKRLDLSKIELAKASLEEFAYAMKTVDSDSVSENDMRKFFYNKPYNCMNVGVLPFYNHNKMQWVMERYFKDLGFTMVREVKYGNLDELPPQKHNIENGPGEFFQGYQSAIVYYEKENDSSKEKNRIAIDMSESYHTPGINYSILHNTENKEIFSDWSKLADDKNFYKGKKININGEFLKLNDVSWDDVILDDKKKKIIRSSVGKLFEKTEEFRKFGISMQRGIILHGKPGTGKTQACRAIASESSCSVLYALPTDFIKNPAIGVRLVTDMAKDLAPCVLIIEDMDWIALDRDAGRAGFVTELMNQMDGIESYGDIVTIGTTNRKDELEDAVSNRPGRFDRLIEIGYPEKPEIEKMIESFCGQWDISSVSIDQISSKLEGLSGAHIKELCKTAAIQAIYDNSISDNEDKLIINKNHFLSAWKEVKNKDMSSFLEMQSKSKKKSSFGFASSREPDSEWDDIL